MTQVVFRGRIFYFKNKNITMNQDPQHTEKSEAALREEATLAFWKENNIFEQTTERVGTEGEYVFFEGPPTANGRPGIHHVAARSFKDIIPRYKTMRGFSVRRKAGWDTHGLPVELQVEKALGLKSKKEIEGYGVAEFNKQCKESVWQYKDEWEKLTERMGYWLDMKDPYVTYENSYIEALWSVVKRADERGHLYRDFKVLPWCTRCGTALSSHELNQPEAHKDVKDLSVYAKFKIVGVENGYFLAWTTTPWTLPGNVGLAVGADIDYVEVKVGEEILVLAKERLSVITDPYEIVAEHKGSEMVGMQYEPLYPFLAELLPLDQKEKLANAYKVYEADFVTTTDGTGIVHTAVMYGAEDFELGTKVGLPKFHTVNEEGRFVLGTGFLEGRYVKEADENGKPTLAVDIVDDLTKRGLLFKKENYSHAYPHCWRCNTPLIYYARTSWYFAMSKLREQLLAANEKISWEPNHIKEGRFGEWLDGIKDWAISRDRYWGTPLPVWSTQSGKNVVIGGLADLKKYAKPARNTYTAMRHGQAESNVTRTWDCGHDPKNHLTEEGKAQVARSAEDLKGQKFDVVITSPFLRAKETMEIVAETLGISKDQIVIDDRLGEWNVGTEFDGKTLAEYFDVRNATHNRYEYEAHGGESFRSVVKRVGDLITELESKYEGKSVLLVGHGSSIRALEMIVEGFTFAEHLKREASAVNFKNAEFRKLDFVPFPHNENYELDFHKPYIDQIELELDGEKLTRTPEVMDVWFDSGSMPYAQDHKLGEPVEFKPLPADYIAEGVDQTRGWFYTMHAIANMMHDTPTQAYKNVICMGLLMDANGQKMSKSKGNIVEPWAMFNKYGADVVRFWFYSVNQPGESKNFDEKLLDETNKKVFNILRNIVSFYEMYAQESASVDPYTSPNVLDQWVLALWNKTLATVTGGLEKYQPLEPARVLRDFIGEFSTWYVRRSRDRFKSGDGDDRGFALATTKYLLQEIAKTMAPFTPFIAEEIWQKFEESRSVHLEMYPVAKSFDESILNNMNQVRELVTLGLDARQKANIKVRQPLSLVKIKVSIDLEYQQILLDELNVKALEIDSELEHDIYLDVTITEELKQEGEMRELSRAIQEMRKNANLMPSDRVVVLLTETEPAWFATHQAELLETVGAEKIVWGSGEAKVDKIS